MRIEVSDISLAGRLQSVRLSLSSNACCHVIGPNGAGKSTLLKILAGLSVPDKGKVYFEGQSVDEMGLSRLAALRSYHHQQNDVPFALSVSEVLAFYGQITHIPAQVERALEITELRSRKLNELSGGEQQRVHLCRVLLQIWPALEQGRGVLIWDEPCQSLDIHHQHNLYALVSWLCSRGNTAIISSHDLNMTAAYASNVLLLDRGNTKAFGAVNEVLTEQHLSSVFRVRFVVNKNEKSRQIYACQPSVTPDLC